jgi:hypothetical protein
VAERRYQIKRIEIQPGADQDQDSQLEGALEEYGEQGWELVQVLYSQETSVSYVLCGWRRSGTQDKPRGGSARVRAYREPAQKQTQIRACWGRRDQARYTLVNQFRSFTRSHSKYT